MIQLTNLEREREREISSALDLFFFLHEGVI